MAFTCPNEGELLFLTRGLTYEGSKLKLYTNNVTWAETSTVGSAIECSTGGYTQKALDGVASASCWSIATGGGGTSEAVYVAQVYTFTSACTAYGYIVTNSAGSTIIVAEAFTDGPYIIPAGGGTITVTPTVGCN
jgi:hypothetical protein